MEIALFYDDLDNNLISDFFRFYVWIVSVPILIIWALMDIKHTVQ